MTTWTGGPDTHLGTGPEGLAPSRDVAPDVVGDAADGDVPVRTSGAKRLLRRLSGVRPRTWVSLFVVTVCCAFVTAQLHPELILRNTTPAGGDMGAHVWGPAYLRDVLLPSGQTAGWSGDWYAGFPAFQFYMVVPSLLIVLLDVLLPYGIAFKLVTISGVVALPVCAWAFGKLARLPFPTPPLLAVGATVFLFDRSFSIYGGNIASTLAGEFAFSMSLALAVLYLGVVARGLDTGRHRGWAALLLALTGLCHLIPAFFAVAGTVLWFVVFAFRDGVVARKVSALAPYLLALVGVLMVVGFGSSWPFTVEVALVIGVPAIVLLVMWGIDVAPRRDESRPTLLPSATRTRLWWLATVMPVGGLLAAFWVLPFYAKQRYLNDMGWVVEDAILDPLFWRDDLAGSGLTDSPQLAWALALGLVGAVLAVMFRRTGGIWLIGAVLLGGVAFANVAQGRLWNTRLLPFYYLALYLLAAVGVGHLHQLLGDRRARRVIGAVATGSVVVAQLLMADDLLLRVPVLGWEWLEPVDGRYVPFVLVGVALVAAVFAAEVATARPRVRRAAGVVAAGLAGVAQLLLLVVPSLSAQERLLPWFLAALLVGGVAVATELVTSGPQVRRAVTGVLVAAGVILWVAVFVGPTTWRSADGLYGWFGVVLALIAVSAVMETRQWLAPDDPPPTDRATSRVLNGLTPVFVMAVVLVSLALPLRVWPGTESGGEYSLGPLRTTDSSFVDGWAAWNYRGYEGWCDPGQSAGGCGDGEKPYFPEYEAIVRTMEQVGEDRGCGRAMWEYGKDLDSYGTPMALMLLPHWTDGCIGSMEGLYFEASATTPYHFLNQDQLSLAGSNAQRGLPYGAGTPTLADFDLGVQHLQMLGVRYYLAFTPEMVEYATEHADLTEIATSSQRCRDDRCPEGLVDNPVRWVVFEVADAPLVESLENRPVVLTGVGPGHTCESVEPVEDPRGRECEGWLDPAVDWYQDPALWSVALAEDGPDDWARIPVDEWLETHEAPAEPVDVVDVSDIEEGRQSLSFTVSQPGTPVLVKTSYFPNWTVSGADGPYRVSPNLMVVVPTEHEVELTYGRTSVDVAALGLSLVGLLGLVVLFRRTALVVEPAERVASSSTVDETGDPPIPSGTPPPPSG